MDLYMDKTEICIADISDAQLIKIYIMPNGVMGLLMIYRQDMMINMSADEKNFPQLEQAAVRCYISAPDTAADSFTRDILEKRSSASGYEWAARFAGCSSSDIHSGMYEKDYVLTQQRLIEHYIGMILKRLGIDASFPAVITGYRTHYALSFDTEYGRRKLPFEFRRYADSCEYIFGNITAPQDRLRLSVTFSCGRIDVTADLDSSRYIGIRDCFDFEAGTHTLNMFDEDEPIYTVSEALSSAPLHDGLPPGISEAVLCTDECSTVTELPWCRVIAGNTAASRGYVIIQSSPAGTAVHEYRRDLLSADSSIVTDSISAVHEIFQRNGHTRISTRFLPTGSFSCGRYKSFTGRTFCRDTDTED